MNKNIAIAVGCACLSFLFLFLGSRSTEQEALLVPVEPVVDFGERVEGQYQKSIELKNVSGKPLKIINVRKACRCNHVRYPVKVIEPDETIELDVEWDLRGQSSAASTNLLVNFKTVPAGEQTYGTFLTLKADVDPDYFLPREIAFAPSETTKDVELVPNVLKDSKVLSAFCAHPAINVEVKSPTLIRIGINSDVKLSDRKVQLDVTTNSVNSPSCIIPIVVNVG